MTTCLILPFDVSLAARLAEGLLNAPLLLGTKGCEAVPLVPLQAVRRSTVATIPE
jgi:hypothetical protein